MSYSTSHEIADVDLLARPGRFGRSLRKHEGAVTVVESRLDRSAIANGGNECGDLGLIRLGITLDEEVEVGLGRIRRGRAVKLQLVRLLVVGDDHPLAAEQLDPLIIAEACASRVIDMAELPIGSAHDHHDGIEVAKIRSNA